MKKLLTGLAVILTLGMIISLGGCPTIDGRPPEYSVENPYAIPDGSGGAVVAYQVNNGNDASTYVQRLDASGEALWGKQGIEIGSGYGGFGESQGDFTTLTEDGQGNVIAVYPQKETLWARKLDMEGNSVWTDGEVVISADAIPTPVYFKAIGDDSGGVVTAWATGENYLGLQKTDTNGAEVWSAEVAMAGLDRFDIAGDDSGNIFIIWKDNPSYSEGDIFVQKVDTDGHVAWPDGGLALTSTNITGYVRGAFDQVIIGDSEGGAVATLMRTGLDVYAQRINSAGRILWGEDGVCVADGGHDYRIVGDAPYNITVFWGDLQNVYAQRLDAEGNISWPEAGVDIGQSGEPNIIMYYGAASDGAGGTIIIWNYEENGNRSLRAQRLDAEGNKLWGEDGIQVSSVSPYWGSYATPARISPDGSGGFFITWAAGEHLKDKTSSYIQRISRDGELLWGDDGTKLDS